MGKIGLIIKREYLTRVRKKSFIIMTFLGPLLMASLAIGPIWLANVNESVKEISILDESGLIEHSLKESDNVKFRYIRKPLEEAKSEIARNERYALVYIPACNDCDLTHLQRNIKMYAPGQVSLNVKLFVQNQIEKQLEREMLLSEQVNQDLVESVERKISVRIPVISVQEAGKASSADTEVSTVLGWFGGILIYFFIFLFGAQAMRGVIEEKTSRIVEVIISSVKPFQLMMGKIVGIALVGLTQFMLWILLTASMYGIFMNTVVKDKFSAENVTRVMSKNPDGTAIEDIEQMQKISTVVERVNQINWGLLIPAFVFYFIFGYLLYGAMFAAIGAAVDSEADTQQFMLPITVPLIFSFVMAQAVLNDPSGSIAKWLSIIPFTSPIIMMVRLPFQVPVWELVLSMVSLVGGFLLVTWIAAKIYRTGILMYGKRVTWKELVRWLRY